MMLSLLPEFVFHFFIGICFPNSELEITFRKMEIFQSFFNAGSEHNFTGASVADVQAVWWFCL